MSRTIDLGSFQWDTNKIEHQIASNTAQMQKYKAEMNELRGSLKATEMASTLLSSRMESERKAQEKLTDFVNKGMISQAEYNKQMEISRVKMDALTAEQNAGLKVQAEANIAINRAQEATKALRQENNELNKTMSAGRVELTGNESAYRVLEKELSALKIEAKNLGAEMITLQREGKEGTAEYKALADRFGEVSKKADDLNNDFKALDKSIGDNHRSVGDYREQIKGAFADIVGGFSMIKNGDIVGGLDAIKGSIQGVTENWRLMGKAFLTNPLTLTLAALSGIVYGFKQILDYNSEQLPKMLLIQNAFGDMGEEADILRQKINGVEDTYGVAFERILSTVDSISSSGLSTEVEAIEMIKKGLSTAPDANEFLGKLDEAASKARQTGISLTEVLNLTKALQGTAIDPGKIYGGIEKASARLQSSISENTELVSVFGETFARDILTKVQSGEITTVQALESVRRKGEEINITIGQQAELGKSLFGKLAANAGAYTETLRLVGEAYTDQYADLTDLQIATQELADRNYELAVAKDAALKSDSLLALKQEFNIFFKRIQIGFYDFVAWLRTADRAVMGSSAYMRGLFKAIPDAAQNAFKAVATAFSELLKGIGSGGSAIAKFFKGDFDGARAEADKFINALPTLFSKIKKTQDDFNRSVNRSADAELNAALKSYDLRVKGLAEVARQEELAKKKLSEVDLTGGKTPKEKKEKVKKDVDLEKLEEAAAKRALELAKYNADLAADIAKNELAEYIAKNVAKLDSDKRLNQQRLAEQIKYFDDLQALRKAEIAAELDRAIIDKDEDQKAQIRREYALKEIDLDQETKAKKKEINKQYSEQIAEDEKLARAIDFETRIHELESNNATEYEIERAHAANQRATELAELEKRQAEELISLENYEAQKKLIEAQSAEAKKKITEAETEARKAAYGDLFGNIATLLGKDTAAGKAAALAQVAIAQGLAIARIWEQKSLLPSPFATVQKVVETGVAVGNVVKAAQQIKSVKAARGMLIRGKSHANGGVDINTPGGMIEAEGGEPILTKQAFKMFPKLISDINVAGGGIPLYNGGGLAPSSSATVQNSLKNSFDMGQLAQVVKEAVIEGAAIGTHSGSQAGLAEMAENRKIANNANF